MSVERYNATRGPALLVQCNDLVREQGRVTMWSLVSIVAKRNRVKGEVEQKRLFHRIRTAVRQLQHSGMVSVEKVWSKERNVNINYITPCKASSE